MPYFVKVGYEKRNVYKTTSKGYHIFREGKKVIIHYGAIEVKGLRTKVFTWGSERKAYEEIYL